MLVGSDGGDNRSGSYGATDQPPSPPLRENETALRASNAAAVTVTVTTDPPPKPGASSSFGPSDMPPAASASNFSFVTSASGVRRRRPPPLNLEEIETEMEAVEVEPAERTEETTNMLLSPKKTTKRAIFVDWARSIAVFVVVIVHIFVSVQRVTTPPPVMKEKIDGSFRVVLQFGLPMFFYFSGRSAAFANINFLRFLKGKILRLVLPLMIGMCIIVIPTNYIGREYRGCSPPGMNNFFEYWAAYWKNFGCNGFDWYWFLPVLFCISCLNQSFCFWVKTCDKLVQEAFTTHRRGIFRSIEAARRARQQQQQTSTFSRQESTDTAAEQQQGAASNTEETYEAIMQNVYKTFRYPLLSFEWKRELPSLIFVVVLYCGSAGLAAGIEAPYEIFGVAFLPYALLFALTLARGTVYRYRLVYLWYVPCALSSMILSAIVSDHYPDNTSFSQFSGVFIMCLFYNFYYLQGYLDSVHTEQWNRWRETASVHLSLKPIALLCLIVFVAMCTPTTADLAGYMYEFPMYKANHYLCFTYVGGSWIWLMIWIRYAQTFYNEVLNEFEYTHVTASSMVVYLTHWFFIDCLSVGIIKKYDMGIVGGLAVLIPGVAICCGTLYALLCFIEKFVKKKLREKKKKIDA